MKYLNKIKIYDSWIELKIEIITWSGQAAIQFEEMSQQLFQLFSFHWLSKTCRHKAFKTRFSSEKEKGKKILLSKPLEEIWWVKIVSGGANPDSSFHKCLGCAASNNVKFFVLDLLHILLPGDIFCDFLEDSCRNSQNILIFCILLQSLFESCIFLENINQNQIRFKPILIE